MLLRVIVIGVSPQGWFFIDRSYRQPALAIAPVPGKCQELMH
jgi:hypothetical protein